MLVTWFFNFIAVYPSNRLSVRRYYPNYFDAVVEDSEGRFRDTLRCERSTLNVLTPSTVDIAHVYHVTATTDVSAAPFLRLLLNLLLMHHRNRSGDNQVQKRQGEFVDLKINF